MKTELSVSQRLRNGESSKPKQTSIETGKEEKMANSQSQAVSAARRNAQAPKPAQSAQAKPKPVAEDKEGLGRIKSWINENLQDENQHVQNLIEGPNDYVVRIISDRGVTAIQPPSVSFKATLGGVELGDIKPKALSFTGRYESSSLKTSFGTKLQFGYDVSNQDHSSRSAYSRGNEPIADLISIEIGGDLTLDRLRGELKIEAGASPSPKVVIQHALTAGGKVRWRRVWEDPKSGKRSGIDIELVLKAEAAGEIGLGAKRGGGEAKVELEVSVRYFGGLANKLDIHRLEQQAADELAAFLVRDEPSPVKLAQNNFGDAAQASYLYTLNMGFGTSPWEFARSDISGGLSHGNPAVDLTINVNRVLHESGYLSRTNWIESTAQAEKYLSRLWSDLPETKRKAYASQLSNPIGLDFGITDISAVNAQRMGTGLTPLQSTNYRSFFDSGGRPS